jgi:hypothetical protein
MAEFRDKSNANICRDNMRELKITQILQCTELKTHHHPNHHHYYEHNHHYYKDHHRRRRISFKM